MAPQARDTMCCQCYRWTHRLTPGGHGIIFCDKYCARLYDTNHHTDYAFKQYKYLAVGDSVSLKGLSIQQEDDAWQALLNWKNEFAYSYNRWTLEAAQRMFRLTSFTANEVKFTRISQ